MGWNPTQTPIPTNRPRLPICFWSVCGWKISVRISRSGGGGFSTF
jgi:hypothetical protein